MIISRYGIELRTLDQIHLQDLREWRNRDETRNYMAFQDVIDVHSQEQWYSRINHSKNLLYTYHFEGIVHGFIQLKDIDLTVKCAEAGIIHGNLDSQNSPVSLVAIILLMEIAFDLLGLKVLKAKIKNDNARVISLNTQLGYKRMNINGSDPFPYYQVNKLRFGKCTKRFRNMLSRRHSPETKLIAGTEDSFWVNKFQQPSVFEFIDSNSFESNV